MKKFTELDVNSDMMINNRKFVVLIRIIANVLFRMRKFLKEQFLNTYKYSNHDDNKFILLLQKGIYCYEYMDNWEQFNETSLPKK